MIPIPPLDGFGSVAPAALRSVNAEVQEPVALTDDGLRDGCTVDLGPLRFEWPKYGFGDFLAAGGPSAAGHSAISGWLSCPESSRLRSLGVQRKASAYAAVLGWKNAKKGASTNLQ